MRARISTFLALTAVMAAPLSAQEYQWRWDRADSYAPIGVGGDRVLSVGELLVSYRFEAFEQDGLRSETAERDLGDVLNIFQSAPFNLTQQRHLVSVQFAPMEYVTLIGRVPFIRNNMDQVNRNFDIFSSSSTGLGDVEVGALLNVYEEGPYKAHLSAMASVPTGSVTADGTSAIGTGRLPYSMQLGSGTVDVMPSVTFQAMNQYGSVGFKGSGVLRVSDNSQGYTLGNRVTVTSWFSFPVSDQLSFSARMLWEKWDPISGSDPAHANAVSIVQDPSVFGELIGGSRLDLPLGVNLNIQNGLLAGHRLGLEAVFPVNENLDGLDLQRSWSVALGWQKPIR